MVKISNPLYVLEQTYSRLNRFPHKEIRFSKRITVPKGVINNFVRYQMVYDCASVFVLGDYSWVLALGKGGEYSENQKDLFLSRIKTPKTTDLFGNYLPEDIEKIVRIMAHVSTERDGILVEGTIHGGLRFNGRILNNLESITAPELEGLILQKTGSLIEVPEDVEVPIVQ